MSHEAERRAEAPKRWDPTWIVWLLLVVAGGFALFAATRGRQTAKTSGFDSKPAKSARNASLRPSASPVNAKPALVTAEGLLQQACSDRPQDVCSCQMQAVERALTLGSPQIALALQRDAPASCSEGARMQGLRAEALARTGQIAEATALLPKVSQLDEKNPSVPYVRSIAALKQGAATEAAQQATAAIDLGRGAPAHVALALAFFQDSELDKADASLRRAIAASPDDVDALYNLAVIDQRRNRYTAARTGYLRLLRARPDHLDARLNLALLTAGIGAFDEARHHQQKLEAMAAPGDPRVAKLSAALQRAPVKPPQVVRQKP